MAAADVVAAPAASAEEEVDYEGLGEGYPLHINMIAGALAGISEHAVMFPVDVIRVSGRQRGCARWALHRCTGGDSDGLRALLLGRPSREHRATQLLLWRRGLFRHRLHAHQETRISAQHRSGARPVCGAFLLYHWAASAGRDSHSCEGWRALLAGDKPTRAPPMRLPGPRAASAVNAIKLEGCVADTISFCSQTRMQVLSATPAATYTGVAQALRQISSVEGAKTLWRGVASVILGAGPAHAVYFGTYEVVKEMTGGNRQGHQFASTGELRAVMAAQCRSDRARGGRSRAARACLGVRARAGRYSPGGVLTRILRSLCRRLGDDRSRCVHEPL
jgi:hypothetical protein